MLLSLFGIITFAEVIPPDYVGNYTFLSGTQGWYVFGSSAALIHKDGYIGASNEGTSPISPAINLYDIIKEAGAGTYSANARVYLNFDPQAQVSARMLLRTDRVNSFATDNDGNCFASIGVETYFDPCTWSNMSGSFKVLESDLQSDTGEFILCFDRLFDYEVCDFYVDDVKVCKLSSDDVTNGDFSFLV